MEYHGKFGRTIGSIKHIALMSRIDICNAICHLAIQNVKPTLTGFEGIKHCVKYLAINRHKTKFHYLNSYDGSNVIRLVEDYTTQNYLECHQYTYQARIINRRCSV